MSSLIASNKAKEIIQSLNLDRLLPEDTQANLHGKIEQAIDESWQQGFKDSELDRRVRKLKQCVKDSEIYDKVFGDEKGKITGP